MWWVYLNISFVMGFHLLQDSMKFLAEENIAET